jgi:hypothetical protein
MKDFLEGRTTSTGPVRSPDPTESKLPPIQRPAPPVDDAPPDDTTAEDPAEDFQADGALETPPPAQEEEPPPPEPSVELLHDDQGRIDHIIVTASNGERIILKCDY